MTLAIKIENISKQYRLGLVSTRTMSHDLNRWYQMNIRGKEDPYLKIGETNVLSSSPGGGGREGAIWALRDINLEVQQGEVLGIIGKNGAGKSTLLKILSKVTAPTKGIISAKGRIASLLEVGTGFHPEMTGRENIYLNGAVLGMSKTEIKGKFDEIVDFSGVERYIDTPVKRYSSGMMVRLGFAVAAHLDPEILIVDEVLAVGDAEFQKKAIGKMQNVSEGGGRTVLFVSHNMGSILQLCGNCILLKEGFIKDIGKSARIVEEYYNTTVSEVINEKESDKDIFIKQIYTCNYVGEPQANFAHKEDIHIRLVVGINNFSDIQNIGICLLRQDKKRVFTVNKSLSSFYERGSKNIEVDFIIEGGLIAPMNYSFLVALNNRSGQITYEYFEDICPIVVYDDGTEFSFAEGLDYGCIILKDKWNLIKN